MPSPLPPLVQAALPLLPAARLPMRERRLCAAACGSSSSRAAAAWWVVKGAIDVDIGANPWDEGGGEDESVDDSVVKVVDIVDTFRLQEQPSFNKKQFVTYMKHYIKLLMPELEAEKQELFKKHIEQATKFLLSMLSDLQL
ncbi:hypothetical protein C4D60_Mb11t11800 [Musa balbisiana]|uniref:TCTP domain-containing protein n=1 Tax=Musa balbisiana TaxID=52838 RepID=A0A4V4H5G5_MUSBA|nr:hypothetical protein C4D60_Mb11t11800 [Musa balbisiana]